MPTCAALWPQAKKTLAFAWRLWDPDRDGVMEGEQHNTYDIEFYGPNTMCGALYLGALRAAEEMARHLGDPDADEYARVYASGRARYDRELWNGEYYVQQVRMPDAHEVTKGKYPQRHPPAIHPGRGHARATSTAPAASPTSCWASGSPTSSGSGTFCPRSTCGRRPASIFRHNFRRSLATHESCQRAYALNEEGGVLQCTWPRGGRPRYPFPYADECWTGSSTRSPGLLIYEGEVEAGCEIVRAVRARHDGIRRNPWDEFECGHHYARALSSWSLLLALSGFEYSAPAGRLRFAPRVSADGFRCLFSTGTAWGIGRDWRRVRSC